MNITQEHFEELDAARTLSNEKNYSLAWEIVDKFLENYPNHVPALILGTSILDKWKKLSLAYQLARRAVDLASGISATWTNFGRVSEELYQLKDAEFAFGKAIELSKNDKTKSMNMNNLSAMLTTSGRWEEAEKVARKALKLDPKNQKAMGNLGLALLGQRQWKEGWANYKRILGTEQRKVLRYGVEPEWDGSPGKTVVIHGEQGLGDEISFSSMIPDALKVCKKVIIDCDHRLEGIFKRSFPLAKVYGTRWEKEGLEWAPEDKHFDASIPVGELGGLFRLKDEDFPGTPFLKADPDRVTMWKALFKEKRKPVIGIAWSGGLQWTGARFRKWKLEEMQPFFDAVDAHWVSLQYKDAEDEIKAFDGAEIHQYPWATLSKDYDDTAALVAACDLLICMDTSVVHLGAALGVETWSFVSKLSQWRYGGCGDSIPWYKSMKVWRQKQNHEWPIDDAAKILKLRWGSLELKRA